MKFIEYKSNNKSLNNISVMISVDAMRLIRRGGDFYDETLQSALGRFARSMDDLTSAVAAEKPEFGKAVLDSRELTLCRFCDMYYVITDSEKEHEELYEHLMCISELNKLEDEDTYKAMYDKALMIATRAHKNQKDKAGKPYIEHPKYVSEHVDGKAEKIVALLHDVIEDTNLTAKDIGAMFPYVITKAVVGITRVENENYPDYIMRLRNDAIARKVKIEDMKYNMDLSKVPEPTDADIRRAERYAMYLSILENDYYYEDLILESDDPDIRMIDYQIDGFEFHRAVRLLKSCSSERLAEALEVSNILKDFDVPQYVQIAALFYCCVEMEALTALGVGTNFGSKVLKLYLLLPWNHDIPLEDKTALLEDFLSDADDDQKKILLAKAIAELREYENKVYKVGQDKVFDSKAEQLRYEKYFNVLTCGFDEYEDDDKMSRYYWTLQNLYKDVFVSYHINKERTEIYQGCDLYCWVYSRDECSWEQTLVRDFPEDEFDQLTREEAEAIEDKWSGE